MRNYVTESIDSFFNSLNSVSNTVWGVLILGISMTMGWYGKTELAYYFAGVGSTLMGVKHDQSNIINSRVITTAPEAKDAQS